MPTFDHTNLGVPEGGAEAEASFLVDVLGYRRVEAPPDIAARFNPMWFEGDDGCQIHLSVDPDHRPAARAHTAVRLGDDLATAVERLDAAGLGYTVSDGDARRVVFAKDPAGNRWELIGTLPG
ncbi:MAG TPA: VOC family protein [Acidimicrobiales bacterium]|nr:VOC family protein [Acidimicrobiales bacterium]